MPVEDTWIRCEFDALALAYCFEKGRQMRQCAIAQPNVKFQDLNNLKNYTDSKIGAYALGAWLKSGAIPLLHTPMRDDYVTPNPNDDFLVSAADGRTMHLIVRHKTVNQLPRAGFELCTDEIPSGIVQVFTVRRRDIGASDNPEELLPAHFAGPVWLVGWMTAKALRKIAQYFPKGTERVSETGVNFTQRRPEFIFHAENCRPMPELLDHLRPAIKAAA